MALPATIRSQVDPAAVTKVTRLFNNTLGDILCELIQNARRAGAGLVEIGVIHLDGMDWLSIADDGAGIADPSVVLALGRSGWDEAIARREDPAGMGVFSLAGREAQIISSPRAEGHGWSIRIASGDWQSGAPISVVAGNHRAGTEIRVAMDPQWPPILMAAAQNAARHCPITVRLDGKDLLREDWLKGAETIVAAHGVRVGLYRNYLHRHFSPSINFHGVTVASLLPTVSEKDRHWSAKVDIVDAPDLQLVLPARKEMVENAALAALRDAVRLAIYRHIHALGSHRLGFTLWEEAAGLGVTLPEARAELLSWSPAVADQNGGAGRHSIIDTADLVLVDDFGAPLEQCAAFALARDGSLEGRLAEPDEAMRGYGWYDRLPRIVDLRFEIERDGEVSELGGPDFPAWRAAPSIGLSSSCRSKARSPLASVCPRPLRSNMMTGCSGGSRRRISSSRRLSPSRPMTLSICLMAPVSAPVTTRMPTAGIPSMTASCSMPRKWRHASCWATMRRWSSGFARSCPIGPNGSCPKVASSSRSSAATVSISVSRPRSRRSPRSRLWPRPSELPGQGDSSMRKIRPASEETRETVAQAIEHLRQARTLLRESGAPRAAEAARHALRSAQGAARHADHRFRRSLP